MSKKSKNRFNVVQAETATAGKTMIEDIAELKERVAALEHGTGLAGEKGEKGDTGKQGEPGKQGEKGPKGSGIFG